MKEKRFQVLDLDEHARAALKKQVRSETLKEAAALFEPMKWLCLDHGGEEAEEIQKRILSLDQKPWLTSERMAEAAKEAAKDPLGEPMDWVAEQHEKEG